MSNKPSTSFNWAPMGSSIFLSNPSFFLLPPFSFFLFSTCKMIIYPIFFNDQYLYSLYTIGPNPLNVLMGSQHL